jgi:hypothetical protein
MKNLCAYCDRRLMLYNDFRRHLQSSASKENNTITDSMLEQLDKNRLTLRTLRTLIYNSAFDI